MANLSSDKNYIENLLKALSVAEAINTFTIIDQKIVQLLECSTNDFLSLNDHFKSYHKESKNIAQNASSIIQIITNSAINDSFANLSRFGDSYDELTKTFSQHVEFLDVEIKKTANKFENLKIFHNNYKQNLNSIKVLLANLNINGPKPDEDNFTKEKSIEILEKIETIKTHVSGSDCIVEQFVNIASESFILLSNIKKENYEQLQKLNDNIEISFALFKKKYSEATALFPALKELTDKNATNIAVIITNLQYHDIIMQKIEHIHSTHKDITADLKNYNDNDQSLALLHNKAKTFLKIRDVAGLQTAQLIHANKQYQMAIEEISANLENIGNEMISISCMCENLVGKSSQTKEFYLNNIVENLNNAHNYNNKLADLISNIKQHTQALSDKNNEFAKVYSEIRTQKEFINEIVLEIAKSAEKVPAKSSKTLAQLNELLKETNLIEGHIEDIHNEINQKVEQIVNYKDNFLAETNILQSLNELKTVIPGLIDMLKESIMKIDEYLYFNTSISLNVSDNIKNSLRKIKYYELFEKASDTIIEELNAINLKLNYGAFSENNNRKDNLKHLKERYTMASEHIIHDHVSKLTEDGDITIDNTKNIIRNLANQNSQNDDDNLELF
jgi:hypothetical protein